MGIRKHIPNALTCCNLLCGCMAIMCSHNALVALLFVLLAAFFDFSDGLAARSLKVYSPIGKDLDSLADMVSFGVAPAFVGVRYIQGLSVKVFGYDQPLLFYFFKDSFSADYIANQPVMKIQWDGAFLPLNGGNIALYLIAMALPLFIAVFSALRLAKFNNDSRQRDNFIGLATPACAIFYISLILALYTKFTYRYALFTSFTSAEAYPNPALWIHNWTPAIIVPVLCWLLVSEIPMFSMKFRNLSWPDNRDRYIFLMIVAVEIVMAIVGGFSFPVLIVAVITTYIIINLLMLAFRKKPKLKE